MHGTHNVKLALVGLVFVTETQFVYRKVENGFII